MPWGRWRASAATLGPQKGNWPMEVNLRAARLHDGCSAAMGCSMAVINGRSNG